MHYHIITLGCPKNEVDSEGMESLLTAQGHRRVAQAADADVIIVNTCSFIEAARDETLAVLQELGEHKGEYQRLVAAGCMAESHASLLQAVPGVDETLSTRAWMQIGNTRSFTPNNDTFIPLTPVNQPTPDGAYADWRTAPIRRRSQGASAYIKIGDGCNLHCAFCTIPGFKGAMRSKSPDAIVEEAQELVEQGVQEIVLVAQHLTDYGRDLGMQDGLSSLLDDLCSVVPTNRWIRLMYAYPHGITSRLIETMARHTQVCQYLDMPLQHAYPDMLRRMHRPADIDRTRSVIADLRQAMPEIALRSTFIVGFPGETAAAFRSLLAFLEDVQLDHVGAFRYSREPGTTAADLDQQVSTHQIERRWHRLMQTQQPIALARNRHWQGQHLTILIEGEGYTEDGQALLVGRSFRDAPEVDGQTFLSGQAPIGSLVQAHITHVTPYDLWGTIVL
ncbi:MAG: 30S ribosomal protein S12 methylthiotransferase RimO [Chloroflexaceae bacterium]|nr:30S ribosomal protein S12 methylthiotransferase RimO [Chloroflexaceae bacterium]